jgi:predicted nuclease of predicted toxin-antitoxin system
MILADENIDKKIIKAIREVGLLVVSIYESHRGLSDFEILELSKNPPFLILTEDKDFGEWVFAHKVKDVSVLLLRYSYHVTDELIKILLPLLLTDFDKLKGNLTTSIGRGSPSFGLF